jgi:hypothetical protein
VSLVMAIACLLLLLPRIALQGIAEPGSMLVCCDCFWRHCVYWQ